MDDLKLIKKHYGEKMMHLCRELFPTILEEEGLLFKIISEHFAYSKLLYEDIISLYMEEEFKDYIFSFIDVENKYQKNIDKKTPEELLSDAGYILYECKNEDDIQSFKKYYAKGEELCTFRGGRLNRCHVFFAVKKDVDKIKREDFVKPDRQDEYGTSVISIQFTKTSTATVSIKNRYNHTVNNPDATFSNNLDNIAPGLTEAFEEEYGLTIDKDNIDFELKNYVKANDGKYYKYNYEINNVYYCPNNIIIDNFEVKNLDKSNYLVFDYFILDLTNKKLLPYDNSTVNDSFIKSIGEINSIRIENNKETNQKNIYINDDIIIVLNKNNQMISYTNKKCTEIGDDFLYYQNTLETIDLINVIDIGKNFLNRNTDKLISINTPNVEHIGDNFMLQYWKGSIEKIEFPKLKTIGHNFFYNYNKIKSIYLPKVEEIGDNFLCHNSCLESYDMTNLTRVGNDFLIAEMNNPVIYFPNLVDIGDNFMMNSFNVEIVNLPSVKKTGEYFLNHSSNIRNINAPSLEEIGEQSLSCIDIDMDKIEEINLEKLDLEQLEKLPYRFREYILEKRGVSSK